MTRHTLLLVHREWLRSTPSRPCDALRDLITGAHRFVSAKVRRTSSADSRRELLGNHALVEVRLCA
jgi:hypothetical protein